MSSRGNNKFIYNSNLSKTTNNFDRLESGEISQRMDNKSSIFDKYKMYGRNPSKESIPSEGSLERGSFSKSIKNATIAKDNHG